MSGNVHQSDKDKLKATVVLAAGNVVEVTQDTAADLKATVTQAEKDRTITGNVTAVQTVGANLKVEASQDPFVSFAVDQGNAALLKATVTQLAKDRTVTNALPESLNATVIQGTAASLKCEPAQGTASNLKVEAYQDLGATYEVTQAAKDRTVTNPTAANLKATVAPSGDMARKAWYDRNAYDASQYSSHGGLTSHEWTVRWTHTIPDNKRAMHALFTYEIAGDIATAAKSFKIGHWVSTDAGSKYTNIALYLLKYGVTAPITNQITAPFILNETDIIKTMTSHDDTAEHACSQGSIITEFDE